LGSLSISKNFKSSNFVLSVSDEYITASVLVGAISTVLLSVTEKTALNASTVTASEESVLAEGLVGVE